MITAKEKIQERFPDRNNWDNPYRQNHQNNGHQDRKCGPDNNVAVADKTKKFSKPRKFDDIENMHYIWHPNRNHMTGDCCIFIDRYTRKGNNGDKKKITRKKMKKTMKIKDSRNLRG
jgi:hypothetical protein